MIADENAKEVSERFDCAAQVFLTSKIGNNLYDPEDINVLTDIRLSKSDIQPIITKAIERRDWTNLLVNESALVPKTLTYTYEKA